MVYKRFRIITQLLHVNTISIAQMNETSATDGSHVKKRKWNYVSQVEFIYCKW